MKNRIVALSVVMALGAMLACGSLRAQEQQPADVPTSHWTYKAIQNLISKGYLALYSDGTFRGDQPVSRYIFAAALNKLLEEIADLKSDAAQGLSSNDVKQVQKLLNEFRNDVSDYDVKIKKLEARLADIESGKVGIQKDVAQVTFDLKEDLANLTSKVDENTKTIVEMKNEMGVMNTQIATLSHDLNSERSQRKQHETILFVLIVAAGIAAASK